MIGHHVLRYHDRDINHLIKLLKTIILDIELMLLRNGCGYILELSLRFVASQFSYFNPACTITLMIIV